MSFPVLDRSNDAHSLAVSDPKCLGAVALVLSICNAAIALSNRGHQVEINQRQMFLQQTAALQAIYNEMVKALADLATRDNDRKVLDVLAEQGIHVTVNASAPPADAAATKK